MVTERAAQRAVRAAHDQHLRSTIDGARLDVTSWADGRTAAHVHQQPDGSDQPVDVTGWVAVPADAHEAAQAVCEAIRAHLSRGGRLPWPTIRNAYDEWALLQ